jgi:hypothetical protein
VTVPAVLLPDRNAVNCALPLVGAAKVIARVLPLVAVFVLVLAVTMGVVWSWPVR